jgi:hypothetical protein
MTGEFTATMFAVLDDVHRTCATTSGAFFYRSFGSAVPRLMNRCLGFRLNAASSRRRQFGRRSYVLDMPEIEGFGGCYRRKGQTNQNDYSRSALKQPGPASSIIRWRSTMGVLTATRGHEKECRPGGAASSRVFKRPARPAFITPHPYGHPQHEQAAEAARSTQHMQVASPATGLGREARGFSAAQSDPCCCIVAFRGDVDAGEIDLKFS